MKRLFYIIIDGLPTFRPDVTVLWGQEMPKLGFISDIVTLHDIDFVKKNGGGTALWAGGRAFTQAKRANSALNAVVDFLHDVWSLRKVNRERYDAVQVRDKTFISLIAMLWARRCRVPFFYWMSFPYGASLLKLSKTDGVRRNVLRRFYLWWRGGVGDWILHHFVLPYSDHIFVQSERMRLDLSSRGVEVCRMTAVPMGIDPLRFTNIIAQNTVPGIPDGVPVVGYLGEASKARYPDFLIEAVAIARETIPDLFLLIVGDSLPNERNWLKECIAKAGLENHCMVTGWLPPVSATQTLARADVCLALMAPDPILASTSPTKLVEYLAMGKPVVANDHPDQRYVVEKSGGGVVVRYDVEAYAQAIVNLLGRRVDHKRMGEAGRAWVLKERSYPKIAERLAASYAAILAPGGRHEVNAL